MSDSMRIALIGQAAFGESVLNALIENSAEVSGVFCPPDQEGRPPDPIKTAAEGHGVPVHQFKRLRDAEAIQAFQRLDADLGVSTVLDASLGSAPVLDADLGASPVLDADMGSSLVLDADLRVCDKEG